MVSVPSACWSDRVTLPPETASVPLARSFIQDLLVEHDLEYLIDDVQLVASELATNAAQHARTDFTVRLQGVPGSVRLSVSDESSSRPIRSEMPPAGSGGGRGLNLVSSHSSDWGVTRGRGTKSVWASFALRSRGPLDAPPRQRPRGDAGPGTGGTVTPEAPARRPGGPCAPSVGPHDRTRGRRTACAGTARRLADALRGGARCSTAPGAVPAA